MSRAPVPPMPRQQDALRFIQGYIQTHGKSPTLEEIAQGIGLRHKAAAHSLVTRLALRGWLIFQPRQPRSIELLYDLPTPRSPDGAPLFAVPSRIEGGRLVFDGEAA